MFRKEAEYMMLILFGPALLATILSMSVVRFGPAGIYIPGALLMISGTWLIISSKKEEAFTSLWKRLGPPLKSEKRNLYFLGYRFYATGFVLTLFLVSQQSIAS